LLEVRTISRKGDKKPSRLLPERDGQGKGGEMALSAMAGKVSKERNSPPKVIDLISSKRGKSAFAKQKMGETRKGKEEKGGQGGEI